MASDGVTPTPRPSDGWKERITIPTILAGLVGGGAGLLSRHRKVHGPAGLAVTYATNLAIVTGCYCGARELARDARSSEQDDLINSAIGGIISGALLGRLQGVDAAGAQSGMLRPCRAMEFLKTHLRNRVCSCGCGCAWCETLVGKKSLSLQTAKQMKPAWTKNPLKMEVGNVNNKNFMLALKENGSGGGGGSGSRAGSDGGTGRSGSGTADGTGATNGSVSSGAGRTGATAASGSGSGMAPVKFRIAFRPGDLQPTATHRYLYEPLSRGCPLFHIFPNLQHRLAPGQRMNDPIDPDNGIEAYPNVECTLFASTTALGEEKVFDLIIDRGNPGFLSKDACYQYSAVLPGFALRVMPAAGEALNVPIQPHGFVAFPDLRSPLLTIPQNADAAASNNLGEEEAEAELFVQAAASEEVEHAREETARDGDELSEP